MTRIRNLLLAAIAAALLVDASLAAADELEERKAALEQRSAQEKEDLREKKERFERLTPAEQNGMREFHTQLETAPDADRLRTVLERYHQWLKTLAPGERADLLALPESERVARIKKLRTAQEEQRFKQLADGSKLTPDDRKAVADWLHEFLDRRQSELLANMPEDFRKRVENNPDPSSRRRSLFWAMAAQRGETPVKPGAEDLAQLTPKLSEASRKALLSVTDAEKQQQLVREWVGFTMANRWLPQVSDEELVKFYENPDKLDPSLREQLKRIETLPRDQMFQELRRLYFTAHFRRQGDWRRPFGGPGGPRPEGSGPGGPFTGSQRDPREGGPGGRGPRGDGPGNRGDGNRGDRRENGPRPGPPGSTPPDPEAPPPMPPAP